jgi:hypothetical protein
MRRSLCAVAATLCVFVCAAPARAAGAAAPSRAAAAAPESGRVFILWLDGTTLDMWARADLRAFSSLLSEGSVAMLSTRTERERTSARAMRVSAAVTFDAGAHAAGDPATGRAVPLEGVNPAALGDALMAARITEVIGDGDGIDGPDRAAALALASGAGPPPVVATSVADAEAPAGRRTDVGRTVEALRASTADVVLVDAGDTARAQRAFTADPAAAARAATLALTGADEILTAMRSSARAGDVVIAIAPTPPLERQREGIRLGAVAIVGRGFDAGLLTSGTTRHDGIVSLEDMAPTLASLARAPMPKGMNGRGVVEVPRANALRGLLDLEHDVVRSARARRPLTREMLIGAMIVVGLALVSSLRPARPPRATLAAQPRDPAARARSLAAALLQLLLVASAAIPLSLYQCGAFPVRSVWALGACAGAICLAAGVAARTFGARRVLAVLLFATAVVPLADLLLGTPLGIRSPLSYQVAGGGRFYGVDDGILGVVVGAEIFAVALAKPRARAAVTAVALMFAATVWLLGSPAYGSKFGATATAVPAFASFVLWARGRRFDLRALATLVLVTAGVTALLIAVDAARAPQAQSHVARAFGGHSDVFAILRRKIDATVQITLYTIWSRTIAVFGGAVAILFWRRPELWRGLDDETRAAIRAAAVAVVAGMLFQDGGVITAAPVALFAAAVTFATATRAQPAAPEPALRVAASR